MSVCVKLSELTCNECGTKGSIRHYLRYVAAERYDANIKIDFDDNDLMLDESEGYDLEDNPERDYDYDSYDNEFFDFCMECREEVCIEECIEESKADILTIHLSGIGG